MSTTTTPRGRRGLLTRGVAAIGAGVLGLAMAFAGATTAQATEPNGIDFTKPRSITIHKFAQPATEGKAPNGRELPSSETAGLQGLGGVQFTIQKVTGVDLTTTAGWDTAQTLAETQTTSGTAAAVAAATALGLTDVTPSANTTSSDPATLGELKFSNLDAAIYIIREVAPADGNPNGIAFPAEPFIVTLPLPLDNEWVYDVHVYPKNSVVEVSKDVDETGAYALGDTIKWTINAKIPEVAEGRTLSKFVITDDLDDRLSATAADVTVEIAGQTLVLGTDYSVTVVDGLVTVTALDLTRFSTELQGLTVVVTIETQVVSNGVEGGLITNTAVLNVNDVNFEDDADSDWGAILIRKHAANDNNKRLKGAIFQVHLGDANGPFTAANAPVGITPGPLSVLVGTTPTTDFETGDNGEVTIPGLRVLDPADGISYWLVETKAPTGYKLPADPNVGPINLVASSTTQAELNLVSVANEQKPPFRLPNTGGMGKAAFPVLGLGIIAFGLVMTVRRRKSA